LREQKEQLEREAAFLRDRQVAANLDPHGRMTARALQAVRPPLPAPRPVLHPTPPAQHPAPPTHPSTQNSAAAAAPEQSATLPSRAQAPFQPRAYETPATVEIYDMAAGMMTESFTVPAPFPSSRAEPSAVPTPSAPNHSK
jgi:hypothetical protein